MDEDVQWIKVKSGLNIASASREDSFCKYLIKEKEVMVVQDASRDKRFANKPAVKGSFGIRSYAGAPLITSDGYHLGSICLLDQQPRYFSAQEKELLNVISRQVVHMMETQLSLKQVETQNK